MSIPAVIEFASNPLVCRQIFARYPCPISRCSELILDTGDVCPARRLRVGSLTIIATVLLTY
jgi:hypothetical protein